MIAVTFYSVDAQTLYKETFEDLSNGVTSDAGNSGWNIDDPSPGNTDFFEKQTFGGVELFYANDTDGTTKWYSDVISTSAYPGGVTISVDIGEYSGFFAGLEADDFIEIYYNTNGLQGADNLIASRYDDFGNAFQVAFETVTSGNIIASQVQIVILIDNDENNESHYFKNVKVNSTIGGTTLYSRANGDWDDGNNWSAIALGGLSCNCFPDETTPALVGNSNTINLNIDGEVNDLTILNTGTILYTNNTVELNVSNDGILTVNSGGTLDENGRTDADVDFEGGSGTSQFVVNSGSTVSIENLYMFGTNALTISGDGNINISDALQFSSGGTITNDNTGTIDIGLDFNFNADNGTFNNNGTIDIGDDIVFNNGDQSNSLTNTGSITVTDDVIFQDDFNTINNSGTFTIGDNLFYNNDDNDVINSGVMSMQDLFVNDAGDDRNTFTNQSGGVVNISATIDFNNGSFTIDNNGTINQTGNFLDMVTANTAINNLNGSTWNWAGTSYDADLPTILDVSTSSNTFNYTGAAAQPVINTTYHHLGMLGSGTNVLQGASTVNGTMTMSSSLLSIGANTLTIAGSGSISGGSSISFVITDGAGELVQNNIGNGGKTGSVLFPVGRTAASYTPLRLDNTTGTADNFGLRVCTNVYEEGGCETGTLVSDLILDRTWFISETVAGGSSADINFQWNGTNEVGSFNRAAMNIIHYNGSIWETLGTGSAMGSDPYNATVTGVSDFSPFTIEDATSPLPVELISFTAKNNNGEIDIEWVTASEINNDYFILERSVDAKSYEELAIITGNGTTNKTIVYDYTDVTPYGGTSYYRLTQVDYDGTFKVYEPVKVEVALTGEIVSYVHPVPSNGDFINVQLSGFDKSLGAQLKIINIKGETMYTQDIFLDENTAFNEQIRFGKKLPAGMYILNITTPEPIIKRIMVK